MKHTCKCSFTVMNSKLVVPHISCIQSGTTMEKVYAVKKRLLGELKCAVCNSIMYFTRQKREVCLKDGISSIDRIAYCPYCYYGKWIWKKMVVEEFKTPCKYQKYGCQFAERAEDISSHEHFCDFSPRTCPLTFSTNCSWIGNLHDLEEHCEEFHPYNTLRDNHMKIVMDFSQMTEKFTCLVIFAYGTVFKCTWEVRLNGLSQFSVTHLGQPPRNKKYTYILSILLGNTNYISKTFAKTCFYQKDMKFPFVGLNRICVPTSFLSQFCNENGELSSTIEISHDFLYISTLED